MEMGPEAADRFIEGILESVSVTSGMPFGSAEFVVEAMRGAGVGAWHLDAVTGLMTWDAVASAILGYEAVPHLSGGLGPVHPGDQARLRAEIDRCLSEGIPYEMQFRGIRLDGSIRWLHAAAGPPQLHDGQNRCLVGLVADTTERRAAEDRLRQAEERQRLVSRAATDLIYEWDIATGAVTWNEALEANFQYRPEELSTPEELHQKLHPDERDELAAQISHVMESGGTQFTGEHRLQRADGSYAEVYTAIYVIRDADGQPMRLVGSILDITDRKRSEAALRDSEAVNSSIVEASTDVIKLLDLDGRLLFMNGSGAEALEIDNLARYYDKFWWSLWPIRARQSAREAVAIACGGGIARFSGACPTVRGQLKWWDVVVSPVFGNEGKPTKLVAISRDITERKEVAERLAWAANYDSLTGLPNRAFFHEALGEAISRNKPGFRLALMLLDLDHFKQVNDTLGHDAGDAVLTTFARRLTEAIDGTATIARLGGDEFAVMIENVCETDVRTYTDAILTRMIEPFVHAGRVLDCRVTIGASLYPDHGHSPDEVLKSADVALYVAKGSHRGSTVMFESGHRAQVQERLSMVSLARTAVKEDRIVPFYQPKLSLIDRTIVGFEALLRWRHSTQGVQLPATIAAAFEDLDVATAISDKMINSVIADMRIWLDQDIPFGHIAVNAAAAEFRRDNFAESVLERLHRAGVPPNCFQLEVTESVFLGRGAECVDRALKLLDASGVTIALDDFGTGYASLRHLKQFPVHVIKIDQSFVRNMNTDPDEAAIIEAVLNLGRSLKIQVVAEGVETDAQARHLCELGCEYGQGFLFAEARPNYDVAGLLSGAGGWLRSKVG